MTSDPARSPLRSPGEVRPLLVSNDFPPKFGGIQQYSAHIARRLRSAAAFAPNHPDAERFDAQVPYPVVRGPSRYMFSTEATAAALRGAIARQHARVLLFMAPFPLVGLARKLDVPWAACSHGAELVIPSKIPIVRSLYRRWLRTADLLFAVSAYTGAHLRRLVGPGGPPIRFLRPGVPLDVFHPAVDGTAVRARYGLADDPVIVCVGRLVPRKGQDVLIDALARIRRQVPRARLLLVGDGRARGRLERAARRLPPGAVVFVGSVAPADLPAYYAAATVFAHPNRSRWFGLEQEGFGVIFLEAQACARPVVAGRSGGSPETLLDGETGVVVDGRNTAAVAEAVARLLADPQLARRMGAAGRRFIEARFDWQAIVNRLEHDLAAVANGEPVEADL